MAVQYGKLCSLILEEHFGEVVTKVSNELHWGPRTLSLLTSSTGLPLLKVSKRLKTLDLVTTRITVIGFHYIDKKYLLITII